MFSGWRGWGPLGEGEGRGEDTDGWRLGRKEDWLSEGEEKVKLRRGSSVEADGAVAEAALLFSLEKNSDRSAIIAAGG